MAVKENVTESVKTQQSLRESNDRYKRLFESSPLALWTEDHSAVKSYLDEIMQAGAGNLRAYFDEHPEAVASCASKIKIVDVNQAAIEMAGAASKEHLIGDLERLFNKASYENLKDQLVWLAAGNLSYEAEVEYTMLNGDRLGIDLRLSISPEFSACWSEVIVSLVDITARKRREKQLAHSMKMEAVARVTRGIAHDFNNVLTVICGNLSLISDSSGHEMGQEAKEMIEDVLSAADDGAQITTRLLSFSHKPTSKGDQISVDALIRDLVEPLKRKLGSGIELSIEIADDLMSCYADKGAFGNVLMNLSINARDAMRDGGTLTFKASNGSIENVAASVSCVVIEVIDTGNGMSAEVIDNATEPFFTTKQIDRGKGLGLSVVQAYINNCSGQLKIDSTSGVGTTIKMYLPLTSRDT